MMLNSIIFYILHDFFQCFSNLMMILSNICNIYKITTDFFRQIAHSQLSNIEIGLIYPLKIDFFFLSDMHMHAS